MYDLTKIKGHLSTINKHKAVVTWLCFRCGLYKQGLLHDLSKYTPTELKTGFKYYQGFRSPIDAQKEAEGCSMSWLHHKGRNPHHWEYWLDNAKTGVCAQPMPKRYVYEMFCDLLDRVQLAPADHKLHPQPAQAAGLTGAFRLTAGAFHGLLQLPDLLGQQLAVKLLTGLEGCLCGR